MLLTLETLWVTLEIGLWGASILLLFGTFLSLYFQLSIQLEKHISIFETRLAMPVPGNRVLQILRR